MHNTQPIQNMMRKIFSYAVGTDVRRQDVHLDKLLDKTEGRRDEGLGGDELHRDVRKPS